MNESDKQDLPAIMMVSDLLLTIALCILTVIQYLIEKLGGANVATLAHCMILNPVETLQIPFLP